MKTPCMLSDGHSATTSPRKFIDLRVYSVDVGTLSNRSGEIAKMLECRSTGVCVQDIRFRESQLGQVVGKPRSISYSG